jgi:6-pyruvoyltetrahydropterin/6-carboxytetrahydropterin synthase
VVEVHYRDRYYAAPSEDVLLLPLNNTSAENLAGLLAQRLLERLRGQYPDLAVRRLSLAVEETPGQRGVYRLELDPGRA